MKANPQKSRVECLLTKKKKKREKTKGKKLLKHKDKKRERKGKGMYNEWLSLYAICTITFHG